MPPPHPKFLIDRSASQKMGPTHMSLNVRLCQIFSSLHFSSKLFQTNFSAWIGTGFPPGDKMRPEREVDLAPPSSAAVKSGDVPPSPVCLNVVNRGNFPYLLFSSSCTTNLCSSVAPLRRECSCTGVCPHSFRDGSVLDRTSPDRGSTLLSGEWRTV